MPPSTLTRLAALALLVVSGVSAAQAQSLYEFRVPKKTLSVTSGSAPPSEPAPSATYAATLSSSALTFSTCTAQTQQVLLSNTGTGALNLTAPTLTGQGFSAATACGAELAPGASCLTDVTWAAAGPGASSGSVTFASNATAGASIATLSGTCEQPRAQLTADTTTDFGAATVLYWSAKTFTVTNTGTAPLTGIVASFSGAPGYELFSNGCGTASVPGTLAPGASCALAVSLYPVLEGTNTGTLSVTSDAPNSPRTLALTADVSYPFPDPYLSSVALAYTAETGTASAPVNALGPLTLTAVGSPQLATSTKVFGVRSLQLDGSSVLKSSVSSTGFGTGDFTVEGWFKYSGTWTASSYIGLVGTDTTGGVTFYVGSGSLRFAPQSSSSTALAAVSSLKSNTWQHLALQRRAGTMRAFVNGVSVGSAASSQAFSAQNFVLGGDTSSAGRFTGFLDDVRVTPGVARYPDTGFSPGPAQTR